MLHGITVALVVDLTASATYAKHKEVITAASIHQDEENHPLLRFNFIISAVLGDLELK